MGMIIKKGKKQKGEDEASGSRSYPSHCKDGFCRDPADWPDEKLGQIFSSFIIQENGQIRALTSPLTFGLNEMNWAGIVSLKILSLDMKMDFIYSIYFHFYQAQTYLSSTTYKACLII